MPKRIIRIYFEDPGNDAFKYDRTIEDPKESEEESYYGAYFDLTRKQAAALHTALTKRLRRLT